MRLNQILQTFILCSGLVTPVWSHAQAVFPEQNGRALAGVKAVDATVRVLTWLEMDSDRERLRTSAQSAFELGLRRDGLIVDDSAPNFLFCELKFARSGGLIANSYQVSYYSFETAGVHHLLWGSGGIVTVGRNKFDPDGVAKDCVDVFANEWLKWNPRR